MKQFFHTVRSDYLKTKRLSLRTLHLLIPAGIAAAFLIYYTWSPWEPLMKVQAYLQILGIGFPFLAGLFCSILAEQESAAGNFQAMLAAPKRMTAFYSKLVLLLLGGLLGAMLSCGLFGFGYSYALRQNPVSLSFYLIAALLLFATCSWLYIWHLFLAFRCGQGITIGLGIAESLVSALLLTGLGDGIWMFIPCSWGSRFVSLLTLWGQLPGFAVKECYLAAIVCLTATLAALLLSGIWFYRWDGRKVSD